MFLIFRSGLLLYTELDKLENEEGIEKFAQMLKDRFGSIPPQVFELFDGLRLRASRQKIGI
jgi:transcription-repair coupling factor (superfamily II helicase)